MAYHHWLKYNRSGTTIEIIIRDDGGAKLDVFKINSTDKKAIRKVLKIIKVKYSIDFVPEVTEKDRDLKWLE